MTSNRAPNKSPFSALTHWHEWADWLEGESIVGLPEVTSSDPELIVDQVAIDGTKVRYRVRGGVLGKSYLVTSRITTSGGRTDEFSLRYTIARK